MPRKKKNLDALFRLKNDLEFERQLDELTKSDFKKMVRKSKSVLANDGGQLVGKSKSLDPNFTLPKGGEVVPRKNTLPRIKGGPLVKRSSSLPIKVRDVTKDVTVKGTAPLKKGFKFSKMLGAVGKAAGVLGAGYDIYSNTLNEKEGINAIIEDPTIPTEQRNKLLAEHESKKKVEENMQARNALIEMERLQRDSFKKIEGAATVMENPDATIKAAKASDLPETVKKDIIKRSSNPEKIAQDIAQDEQPDSPEDKAGSNIRSSFMESLAFFLPTALGAGIGAAIEGSAGAVAGAQYATQLAGSKRQYDMDKEALQIKKDSLSDTSGIKEKPLQQSGALDKRTGEPLIFDPNEGVYKSSSGEKVDSSFVVSGTESRFSRREAQLSSKQQDKVSSMDAVAMDLEDIKAIKKSVNTGPLAGRAGSVGQVLGISSDEFSDLKTKTEALIQNFAKMKQGGKLSDQDIAFNRNLLPNINDDDSVFNAKLEAIEDVFANEREAFMESIESGQKMKSDAVLRIRKRFSQLNNQLKSKSSAAGKGSVATKKQIPHGTETIKNGKKYKYNSKTGTFQRAQ